MYQPFFQTFAEIMEKAENGSMRPVHEYISDLSKNIDTSSENFYSGFAKYEEDADMGEVPGFFFGKTVFKKLGECVSLSMFIMNN